MECKWSFMEVEGLGHEGLFTPKRGLLALAGGHKVVRLRAGATGYSKRYG